MKKPRFLVACTRLYQPLCRLVGLSVAEDSEHATYGDLPCSSMWTFAMRASTLRKNRICLWKDFQKSGFFWLKAYDLIVCYNQNRPFAITKSSARLWQIFLDSWPCVRHRRPPLRYIFIFYHIYWQNMNQIKSNKTNSIVLKKTAVNLYISTFGEIG